MEHQQVQLKDIYDHKTGDDISVYSILLADDDLEMRKLLAWSLKRNGYQVVECSDGNSLMKKLGLPRQYDLYQSFDLIISDIRMPGATGIQILESVQELDDFPPIILITAFPDEKTKKQVQQLGAAALFNKPFDVDELIDKVKRILLFKSASVYHRGGSSERSHTDLHFPLEITFRYSGQTGPIKEYVREMAVRLSCFTRHIDHIRVVIKGLSQQEHKRHHYNITINIKTSNRTITVKHHTDTENIDETLYLGIHIAFDMACRQLKQYLKKSLKRKNSLDGSDEEEDI